MRKMDGMIASLGCCWEQMDLLIPRKGNPEVFGGRHDNEEVHRRTEVRTNGS